MPEGAGFVPKTVFRYCKDMTDLVPLGVLLIAVACLSSANIVLFIRYFK